MYVAPQLDKSWLLSVQRKLYERSRTNPDYAFEKLWGLITDPRNLRIAVARVASNRGRRSAGVDGLTVRKALAKGVDGFVANARAELRSGAYRPSPVRRVRIPKPGQPGKFRPLGIPTVRDRVVQAAMKNILEPIFEADFFPTSYGFRPCRSAHAALEHSRMLLRPRNGRTGRRLLYQWAIEGDIKGCFDNIDHHQLMRRVRRRVDDSKLNRLVVAFLKAGILSEKQFLRSEAGAPQGGILSPLLANIALSAIDERYARHAWPRRRPTPLTDGKEIAKRALKFRRDDREGGCLVLFPIRYADDFIIFVSAPAGPMQDEDARLAALDEKEHLATFLRNELRLELSATKTLVTPVTGRMRFLGHHVCVRPHPKTGRMVSTAVVPRDASQRLRERIKALFRRHTTWSSLAARLQLLNPMLRGWANFYRHAWGAKRVFSRIDHYVWWTIFRWARKRHPRVARRVVCARYAARHGWCAEGVARFKMAKLCVEQFKLGWMRLPRFAESPMESPMHNERCTSGSVRGAQKPTGASRTRR